MIFQLVTRQIASCFSNGCISFDWQILNSILKLNICCCLLDVIVVLSRLHVKCAKQKDLNMWWACKINNLFLMWYLYCSFLFSESVTVVFSYPFVYKYTKSSHFFLGKKSPYVYIYIRIFIFTQFLGVTPPPPKKKHIINESHGFAPIFREICWLLPWSDHGHQIPAGPGSEPDKQLRRISHSFWKPRISRRSTDCRIYIWCIYLHYGEKNG